MDRIVDSTLCLCCWLCQQQNKLGKIAKTKEGNNEQKRKNRLFAVAVVAYEYFVVRVVQTAKHCKRGEKRVGRGSHKKRKKTVRRVVKRVLEL